MVQLLLGLFQRSFYSRRDLLLENLALRQQLSALKRQRPKPRLTSMDRLFWVTDVAAMEASLAIVTLETVVRWHLAGFRLYWDWISRHRNVLGRKRISNAS